MKSQNQDRDKTLISFYLKGNSLRQTAEEFQITFQRVHQILSKNNIKPHTWGIISTSKGRKELVF